MGSRHAEWERLAPVRRARLAFWLQAVGSPVSLAVALERLDEHPRLRALAAGWSGLGEAEQHAAAVELDDLTRAVAYGTRPYCVRCGACCRNAGPTLYPGDEPLWRDGVITAAQLVTYRAGEEVFSHALGRRTVLQHECVALAAAPEGGCPFAKGQPAGCAIYAERPRQCRVQRCWDPAEGSELARARGLRRVDLLGSSPAELGVIAEHDERCDPSCLRRALERLAGGDATAAADALELCEADRRIRGRLIADGADPEALDFLLGRPLQGMLAAGGYELVEDDGQWEVRAGGCRD